MTELETIARAKMYLDKLANGINPIDDSRIPDGDAVRNVRLSRCFSYVSEILEQVLENGGVGQSHREKARKQPFSLTPEQRSRIPVSPQPVTVSVLTQTINQAVDLQRMTALKTTQITDWLVQIGMLEVLELPGGHHARRATDRGCGLGLANVERTAAAGTYIAVTYDPQAQQFVLDNLEAALDLSRRKQELENRPWTQQDDVRLRQLFLEGASPAEAAAALQRRPPAVRARIKNLRLNPEDIG